MSQQQAMTPRSRQFQVAAVFGATTLILAVVMGFAYLTVPGSVPFIGFQSLAVLLTAITLTFAMAVTALGYRHIADIDEDNVIDVIEAATHANRHNFVARIAISIVVGVLLTALWLLFLYIFTKTLGSTMEVNWIVALVLAGTYGGILGFAIAYWASKLSTGNIMVVVGLFMIMGLSMAMIMVEDPDWFYNSLSFMGHDSGSNMFFNATMILGGLVLLGFNQDILTYLKILVDRGKIEAGKFRILRAILIVIPVCVTFIGLFPTTVSKFSDMMHNLSADLTALLFIALMFTVHLMVPIYPPYFINRSRIMGVLAVGFGLMFVLGRVEFTVFELFLIGTIGIWVLTFYTETMNVVLREVKGFDPDLIDLGDVELPGETPAAVV
ncbi:hypothetical protein ACFLYO_06275 [Chloroflexota bacterium]